MSQPDLSSLFTEGVIPARIPTASARFGYFSINGVKIAPPIEEPYATVFVIEMRALVIVISSLYISTQSAVFQPCKPFDEQS